MLIFFGADADADADAGTQAAAPTLAPCAQGVSVLLYTGSNYPVLADVPAKGFSQQLQIFYNGAARPSQHR